MELACTFGRPLPSAGIATRAAAAQMAALAQQLAAGCIDAYCRGCFASLGFGAAAGKADLPRDWLSQLLLQPLLRAACRWATTL